MTSPTTTPDRHEQRKLETRQKLLDAAEQVFGKMGYADASVLDITEAANVSKRTFYLHFADKEAVIEALAMRSFLELREQAEAHEPQFDTSENYRKGLYNVCRIIFEFAAQRSDFMQIVFGAGGSFRLQAMAREFMTQAWEENIHRKCDLQDTPPVPASIMANGMAGLIFQLMCWWTQHPNDYTPDAMADFCVSLLCDGIEINFLQEAAASLKQS